MQVTSRGEMFEIIWGLYIRIIEHDIILQFFFLNSLKSTPKPGAINIITDV